MHMAKDTSTQKKEPIVLNIGGNTITIDSEEIKSNIGVNINDSINLFLDKKAWEELRKICTCVINEHFTRNFHENN